MPLKEAVREIVAEMEQEAQEATDLPARVTLKAYARALRAAAQAAGDPPPPAPQGPPLAALLSPEVQHRLEIEKAKAEFRKPTPTGVTLEEQHDGQMVWTVGGPAGEAYNPVNPQMPVGAYTHLAGALYKLEKDPEGQGHRLVYQEGYGKPPAPKVLTGG